MREARPPIPRAREGGPRRPELRAAAGPSARRGAPVAGRDGLQRRRSRAREARGRAATGGHYVPGAGRDPPPADPHSGTAMRESRPGSRAGCASRTKAGRRGRSWGLRASDPVSPGRATAAGNFATFAEGDIGYSASCCTQFQIAPGWAGGRGDTTGSSGQRATASSTVQGRRGRPSGTGTGTEEDQGH